MKKDIIIDHAVQLTAGNISRRKFIMTAIAAGATLPMAMTMATNAIAATPVKGGRLRQGLGYGSTTCLLYTSPSPRDLSTSRMPSSA